jgi:hypothetical protein
MALDLYYQFSLGVEGRMSQVAMPRLWKRSAGLVKGLGQPPRLFSPETPQRGIQQGHDLNRHPDRGFAESHAAAIKQTVIRAEKTMGVVKTYLQLKAVTATKQMASAHAMLRTRAKVSAGSPPSSHANTAANKRNTETKSPNALKKSQ